MYALVLSLLTLAAAPAAPPLSSLVGAGVPGTVEVTVTGARSDEGRVVAMLFSGGSGFPFDATNAAYTASGPIRNGTASIQVPRVAASRYAIVVFHDADGNGRIKRNVIGIPREGVGVTRFSGGRPSFNSAAVDVPAAGGRFTIGLNYR